MGPRSNALPALTATPHPSLDRRLPPTRRSGEAAAISWADIDVAVTIAWLAAVVPLAATMAIVAVAAFNIRAVRTAPRPAKIIGLQQMFFGLAVVIVTAIAVLA